MKIAVVGTGFVGLSHAAVLAEAGHEVLAVDVAADKIECFRTGDAAEIERHVSEPGLSASVKASIARGRLTFATALGSDARPAEAVFLCLPTPPDGSGATDLGAYFVAVRQVAEVLAAHPTSGRRVVVTKSTVPIGTAGELERELAAHGVHDTGVASNPEFLPQGNAVAAARRPDRVVVGARDPRDFAILRRVYAAHAGPTGAPYIETTPETAEAIKYVSNALLLTYISFWNGVAARLAETLAGVDMGALRRGVTGDRRISTWGSLVGNGAGGSCFGKDILSLIHQLSRAGQSTEILRAVHAINEYQKTYLLRRAEDEVGFTFNRKTVAVLGLAFKKDTNDLRDSSAVRVIESLLARGVDAIRAYDPLVSRDTAREHLDPERNHLLDRVVYCESAERALAGSDALFISSDSDAFTDLEPVVRALVAPPYLVIDGRRMLGRPPELAEAGYTVLPVGGAPAGPNFGRSARGGTQAA